MKITKINNQAKFIKENPIREMSNLEIEGAIHTLYRFSLTQELDVDIEDIDSMTYYCDKVLQIHDGLMIEEDVVLDSVFVIGENREELFGYLIDEDREEFSLVRFTWI